MKNLFYFLFGATVGALAALIMAPKSGEELRGDLQQRASSLDMQRLQKSYEQGLAEVNKRLEQVQVQLKKNQKLEEAIAEEVGAE
jgi:gas vesicle protein